MTREAALALQLEASCNQNKHVRLVTHTHVQTRVEAEKMNGDVEQLVASKDVPLNSMR